MLRPVNEAASHKTPAGFAANYRPAKIQRRLHTSAASQYGTGRFDASPPCYSANDKAINVLSVSPALYRKPPPYAYRAANAT